MRISRGRLSCQGSDPTGPRIRRPGVPCRGDLPGPSGRPIDVLRGDDTRGIEDQNLTGLIVEVHHDSRGTYGAPRIHTELRMGLGLRIGRKRVARLMRVAGIHCVSQRRKRRHRPDTATQDDLVQHRFNADGPDRVHFTDITQHQAAGGLLLRGHRRVKPQEPSTAHPQLTT